MRAVSPMLSASLLRMRPGAARSVMLAVAAPLGFVGIALAPGLVLFPLGLLVSSHVTDWSLAVVAAASLLVLVLLASVVALRARSKWVRSGVVDLDSVALVLGCAFWCAAAVLWVVV